MRAFPNPTRSRHRALALVVALCALAVLLIVTVTTTEAFVSKLSETTLADFASGSFYRTSLLDVPPIDGIQLLPVGLSGQWEPAFPALPEPLTEMAVVSGRNAANDKGQIVVMGGFAPGYEVRDTVYVNTLNADGSLGTWISQTHPLPQALSSGTAVIYPRDANSSWIYVLGGTNSSGDTLDTVYYTILNHNTSTISDWTTNSNPLSLPVSYEAATAHNGYVYVIGGDYVDPPFPPEALETVFYAKIQADGSLGQWQEAEALPQGLESLLAVAYGEEETNTHILYALGGWDGAGTRSNWVYFADIDPDDGSLSPWQQAPEGGSLPLPIYSHSGVLFNGQILVTGGKYTSPGVTDEVSATVKAALVDPENTSFRLFDWCQGDPTCTIGAWQAGPLLRQPRAYHVTVENNGFVYTIGGVDENGNLTAAIDAGATSGDEALYSPSGHYISSELDFGVPVILHKLEWGVGYPVEGQMSLEISYRYKAVNQPWSDWSSPVTSVDGSNTMPFPGDIGDNVLFFQYRVDMATDKENSSPHLDWIDVYYEVTDPEVSVSKNTKSVITASLATDLDYTIHFTNTGQWRAENVVLTETLPANTTYAGGPEWQQVGATNQYTYAVGNVNPGATGDVPFRVRVNDQVPPGTTHITNTVEIGYPPMYDAIGDKITDPQPENNYFEFSNPLMVHHLYIEKDATPTPDSWVQREQRITYTLSYLNDGSAALSGVVLTDVLPAEVSYAPDSISPPGDDSDPTQLTWNIGDLASGQGGTASFVVTVKDDIADGTRITNTFTADSLETDPKVSPSVVHTVTVPPVNFVLSKTATPAGGSVVEPEQKITYTLTYLNNGDGPGYDVVLADVLPPEVTYVDGSIWPSEQGDDSNPAELRWTIGKLDTGIEKSAGFVVTVNSDVDDGINIVNQFTLDSADTLPKASPVVTHLIHVPGPSLALTKSATPAGNTDVAPGQRISYTLHYVNDGEVPLTQVVLADAVPAYASYITGTIWPSALGNATDPSNLKWTLGNLAVGAEGSVGFSVSVDDVPGGLLIQNSFDATSQEIGLEQSNTVQHTVIRQGPDLTVIDIVVDPEDPSPGESFAMIVTVENIGSQDADDEDFWVEVYIKPRPSAWPQGPSDHYMGICTDPACTPPIRYEYSEGLTSLAAGASFPLRFEGLELPGVGNYDLYAQVDIAFEGDDPLWGRYLESNESNNIRYEPMEGNVIYLPLVAKRH